MEVLACWYKHWKDVLLSSRKRQCTHTWVPLTRNAPSLFLSVLFIWLKVKQTPIPHTPEQGCSLCINHCECHIFLPGKGLWLMIHSLCQTILVKRFISLQRWWIASIFWAFWWSWVPSVALMLHIPAVPFLAFCELQPVLPSGLISTGQLRPE